MGLSIPVIAGRIGIHERTWSRWENNHAEPSPLAIGKLKELQAQHNGQEAGSGPLGESESESKPRRREVESPLSGGVIPARRLSVSAS